MQSLVTQTQSYVKIRRSRSLSVLGTVLVRVGQKVTPSEILAEGQIPTKHIMIDVMRSFGLKNVAEAEKMIIRKVGEQLEKQDIIVESGGLFSRVIRAPMPGKIVSKKNAQVLMEVESRRMVVQSGFTGRVVEILKDRGVVIEADCTLIQGVWGNGKIGFGPFMTEQESIDQELTPSTLSITSRGTILAAACCHREESLIAAASLPLSGLILGSMDPKLIPCALRQEYPIILLEGFGKVKINDFSKKLLAENSQREMSLNAVKWEHFYGLRPEICIAHQEDCDPEIVSVDYEKGQTVRIHSSPYMGQVGTINAIISGKTTLPNGLRTETASILLQNNKKVIVPFSNFEIINTEMSSLG